jgi:energy-coupling factor transporter ATP-binding protein EcfA2
MIGDDYLHLRAQLGAAVFSLSSLANDLNADPQIFDSLHDLGGRLREPLLLVAIGDTGAGKSSLLNALFGRELCAVGEQAASEFRLFTFGPEASDHEHSGVIESRRNLGFLRDFQAMEASGIAAMTPEQLDALAHFLNAADAVLVVLSATNPWPASTWDSAHFLSKNWPHKIVFVLQQADQCSEEEVAATVGKVGQNVHEKLGMNRPIFAVSAKDALSGNHGVARLAAFIDEGITKGDLRPAQLRDTCEAAEKTLAQMASKAREAMSSLKKEGERLTQLQEKLHERKEESLRGVGGALWTLAQTFETAQKRGEELLQNRLSIFSTLKILFLGGRWEPGMREEVEVRLRESLGRQIGNAVDLLLGDLKNAWQDFRELLGESFAGESLQAPDFEKQRENLIQCIEAGLGPHLSADQLEIELPQLFGQMSAWLRLPLGFALTSALATVAAMLAQVTLMPLIGALTAASASFGLMMTAAKRNKMFAIFRETMVLKREAVLAPIEDHMRHSIEVFYKGLPATFELLQGFCETQGQIYAPLLDRVQQLEEMLGNLGNQLGAASKNT